MLMKDKRQSTKCVKCIVSILISEQVTATISVSRTFAKLGWQS